MIAANPYRPAFCRFAVHSFSGRSASLAIALLLIVAGCATKPGVQLARSNYICADGTALRVARQGRLATVAYEGSLYRLTHKLFSLGERYTSPDATLIIDGRYVVFVTEAEGDLHECYLDGRLG